MAKMAKKPNPFVKAAQATLMPPPKGKGKKKAAMPTNLYKKA